MFDVLVWFVDSLYGLFDLPRFESQHFACICNASVHLSLSIKHWFPRLLCIRCTEWAELATSNSSNGHLSIAHAELVLLKPRAQLSAYIGLWLVTCIRKQWLEKPLMNRPIGLPERDQCPNCACHESDLYIINRKWNNDVRSCAFSARSALGSPGAELSWNLSPLWLITIG